MKRGGSKYIYTCWGAGTARQTDVYWISMKRVRILCVARVHPPVATITNGLLGCNSQLASARASTVSGCRPHHCTPFRHGDYLSSALLDGRSRRRRPPPNIANSNVHNSIISPYARSENGRIDGRSARCITYNPRGFVQLTVCKILLVQERVQRCCFQIREQSIRKERKSYGRFLCRVFIAERKLNWFGTRSAFVGLSFTIILFVTIFFILFTNFTL